MQLRWWVWFIKKAPTKLNLMGTTTGYLVFVNMGDNLRKDIDDMVVS